MRRVSILLFLLALASCAPSTPPVATPAPDAIRETHALAAAGTAERVVLVSLDGLGADALARQTGLPGFERLTRDGARARLIPVNPAVTQSTHATILTGADPQRHGIVSNRFHAPGRPREETALGRTSEVDMETLVDAARRQGRRVGAVLFPTIDARTARRSADFGLAWTQPLSESRVLKLTRASFRREWVPPTWRTPPPRRASHSPVVRARIDWGAPPRVRADVDLVAYDTSDDGVENYDALFIEVDGTEAAPDSRGWVAVSKATPEGLFGSWSKIMSATPGLDIELYWGMISKNDAYPDEFRSMLDARVGFWPGAPDETAEIDPDTFAQQIERLARFVTGAQILAIEQMDFDLLLAYQPQIDEASHNFLGYDDNVVREAFVSVDRTLQEMLARLDLSRTALVVVGDHGLVRVERQIRVNRLLADHGLYPRWRAFASGSVAHLYRIEEPDDSDAVAALLQSGGWFERVDRRERGWHANSGDLMVWAPPGTDLSASDEAPAIAAPDSYGNHGALNHHPEMHSVLLAAGRGVPTGTFRDMPQTGVLRFVCDLAGIIPPSTAE